MIVPIPFALLLGANVTFLLLLAAHLICWRWRDQMHRTVAYCVGVSCIGAGMLTVSALLQDWLIVVAFVTVALPGGGDCRGLGPELTPALASELQIILDAADRMHAYHARIRHQLSSALKQDKGLLS